MYYYRLNKNNNLQVENVRRQSLPLRHSSNYGPGGCAKLALVSEPDIRSVDFEGVRWAGQADVGATSIGSGELLRASAESPARHRMMDPNDFWKGLVNVWSTRERDFGHSESRFGRSKSEQ
jgi:hypothetical protein